MGIFEKKIWKRIFNILIEMIDKFTELPKIYWIALILLRETYLKVVVGKFSDFELLNSPPPFTKLYYFPARLSLLYLQFTCYFSA